MTHFPALSFVCACARLQVGRRGESSEWIYEWWLHQVLILWRQQRYHKHSLATNKTVFPLYCQTEFHWKYPQGFSALIFSIPYFYVYVLNIFFSTELWYRCTEVSLHIHMDERLKTAQDVNINGDHNWKKLFVTFI